MASSSSASTSKRPADDISIDQTPPAKKMHSLFASPREVAPNLAKNKLDFSGDKVKDTLTISTWNVRSLKSCSSRDKGYAFRYFIEAEDPALIVLTETHLTKEQARDEGTLQFLKTRYKGLYWSKKVAVLSKTKPISVTYGLPDWAESDQKEAEERCITLEFPTCFVIGAYVQNSGSGQKSMGIRQAWNRDLIKYIAELEPGIRTAQKKAIIHIGDFNVMAEEKDVERASQVWNVFPGALPAEREDHARLLERHNLVDVWRLLHPDKREFTHSTIKYGGMRLDGFICSRAFLLRVRSCMIRSEVIKRYPNCSDHWPVSMVIEGSL